MNFSFECFRHFLDDRLVVFLDETVEDGFFLTVVAVFDFYVGLACVATQVHRLVGGVKLRIVLVHRDVVVDQDSGLVYVGREASACDGLTGRIE